MANTSFNIPVTASQVGSYFLGQYYKVLQQQPDYLHQFYTASSTMLRIDGTTRQTATSLTQIHGLVMSLNYTGVEIKTANSLESLNRGVLVMVYGLMRSKDFDGKRKFVETFFLAPQDTGYFVLNNIFHIVEDEPCYPPSVPYLDQNNQGYLSKSSAIPQKSASNYMMSGETRYWDSVSPATAQGKDPADKYTFSEQELYKFFEAELILENDRQSNDLHLSSTQTIPSQLSHLAEEFTLEPQKHTYASIVTKMQSKDKVPKQPSPKSVSTATAKSSTMEGEIKSVYIKNLPTFVTPFEIEEVFKKFGRIKPYEGVCIRSQKETSVCYGFIEFEDVSGVQNAIKASKVEIAGREVLIEERRPEKIKAYRGRGRGKGGKKHSKEASMGYFGGHGSGKDSSFYRKGSIKTRLENSVTVLD